MVVHCMANKFLLLTLNTMPYIINDSIYYQRYPCTSNVQLSLDASGVPWRWDKSVSPVYTTPTPAYPAYPGLYILWSAYLLDAKWRSLNKRIPNYDGISSYTYTCVCFHLPGLPGCSPISGELCLVIIFYIFSINSTIFKWSSAIIFRGFSSSSVKYLVYSKCFASTLVILHSLSTCFCVSSSSWHRRHIPILNDSINNARRYCILSILNEL